MAFQTLVLENNAIDVAISKSGTRLAVLSGKDIALYALDMSKRPIPKPAFLWRNDAISTHCPRHIAFVGDDELFCLTDNWDEDESCLWRSVGDKMVSQGPIIDGSVSSLTSDHDYHTLCVQFQNGGLHSIDTGDASTDLPPQTLPIHKFPSLAPDFRIVTIDGEVCSMKLASQTVADHSKTLAFGLTKSGILFANGRIFVRNCTSFALTPAHLVFTTTQHLLKFAHLVSVDGIHALKKRIAMSC
jgi:elongator complex protein 1